LERSTTLAKYQEQRPLTISTLFESPARPRFEAATSPYSVSLSGVTSRP
jgi:hypothetical protein